MKHKFLTVLLALVAALCLCFGLAACGENSENSGNSEDSGSSSGSGNSQGGGNEQGGGNDGDVCEHAFTVQNVCEKCGEKWEFTEGLEYELDKEADGYSVSGIGTASGDIVIPYGYSGKAVTSIGDSAFKNCKTLTSAVIPGSVTVIGYNAFDNCSGLTSVEIPDSVTEIRHSAFRYCNLLTDAEIPDSVTEIQPYAFWNCNGLTSINIPNGVTKIQSGTFDGCDGLTSVKIPDSVTEIGYSAFMGCSALAKIEIPDGVTKIGHYAFRETAYYYDAANWDSDGVLYLGKYLIDVENTVSGEITVKPGTKVIADSAFGDEITSIVIPDSVITVGEISSKKLTSITVDDQNQNYSSECGVLYNKEKTEFYVPIAIKGDVVIPDGVTTIGWGSIAGRIGMTSVTIGKGVTEIQQTAFNDCIELKKVIISDLAAWCKITFADNPLEYAHHLYLGEEEVTELVIPDEITEIKDRAFYGCEGLTSVKIGSNVTSIGEMAFAYCSGLTSIEIPNSVTSIGKYAFIGCSMLTDIQFKGSVSEWSAISKGSYWNDNIGNYTVTCTDGKVTKNGTTMK